MRWGGAGFHPREVPMATTWIMPLFPAPAMQISPTRPSPSPHPDVTPAAPLRLRAPRPRGWRQGVQTAGVGVGWQRQEFAWRCRASVCVPGRRQERGGGGGRRGASLSPRVAIFSCLSDCYRCAHSWVSPWLGAGQAVEGLASDFFLVSPVCGRELRGGGA